MLFLVIFAFFIWSVRSQGGCTFHQSFPDPTTLSDLRPTTAFTYIHAINETDCLSYSTNYTLVETAIVDGTSYEAFPTVVVFDLETGTIFVTGVFPSLLLTKFTPGQTVTILDNWGGNMLIGSLTTENGMISTYAESIGSVDTHTFHIPTSITLTAGPSGTSNPTTSNPATSNPTTTSRATINPLSSGAHSSSVATSTAAPTGIPAASYAAVGGIVGGVVGVIVVAGAFVLFSYARRRRGQAAQVAQPAQPHENIEEPPMRQLYEESEDLY